MVIFGVAHGYQGPSFAVRAFFAGVVMGALALATGSVVPSMVLHALVDLAGGYAGFMAMRDGAAVRAVTRVESAAGEPAGSPAPPTPEPSAGELAPEQPAIPLEHDRAE